MIFNTIKLTFLTVKILQIPKLACSLHSLAHNLISND